jgi:sterol desaturase/sphingolipid hydroxylase (fatty acid hydroxylase superfamily)
MILERGGSKNLLLQQFLTFIGSSIHDNFAARCKHQPEDLKIHHKLFHEWIVCDPGSDSYFTCPVTINAGKVSG